MAVVNRITREQRETEATTLAGLRSDAATALGTVIGELRQRLLTDRAKGELFAVRVYGRPREAAELDRLATEAAPGERPALILELEGACPCVGCAAGRGCAAASGAADRRRT
jgi:hypothetical protein